MHKIHITIFALVFVMLMISLPMTLAVGPSGKSWCSDNYNPPSDYPCFNDCEHSALGASDNMMVGLGLYTDYDPYAYYYDPYYNYGNWWFSTQAGCSSSTYDDSPVRTMPPMQMTFDVDFGLPSATRYVTYDYSSGEWLNSYWYYEYDEWKHPDIRYWNGQQYVYYYCNYVGSQWNWDFGDRYSAEGMTRGAFFYINNPWTVYYKYAQTSGYWSNMPEEISSYAFLTAHYYSQFSTYGDWLDPYA